MVFRRLTIEERCNIKFLRELGPSIRSIARHLGRSAPTVLRERRRNGGPGTRYDALAADAPPCTSTTRWATAPA